MKHDYLVLFIAEIGDKVQMVEATFSAFSFDHAEKTIKQIFSSSKVLSITKLSQASRTKDEKGKEFCIVTHPEINIDDYYFRFGIKLCLKVNSEQTIEIVRDEIDTNM